jgi:hypothetical protein
VTEIDTKKRYGAFKIYLISLVALGIAVYLGYMLGNNLSQAQQAEIDTLNQTVENINIENNKLTKNLNILGVELEVQRLASQQAQSTIEEGMVEQARLREELAFYQKVMAPELKQDGFVIEAFNVAKALSDNTYTFDLVLMQQDKIKTNIKGNVDVTIRGSQSGQVKELRLLDLMPQGSKPLVFSFRYFQVIEGQFELPLGFAAESILVRSEVYQFKRKRGDLEVNFDWVLKQQE